MDLDGSGSEVSQGFTVEGDLGFGHGLKPGAVSVMSLVESREPVDMIGCDGINFEDMSEQQSFRRFLSLSGRDVKEINHDLRRRHSAPQARQDMQTQNNECSYGNHHLRPTKRRSGFFEGLRAFLLRSTTLKHLLDGGDSGLLDGGDGTWSQKDFTQLEAATQEVAVLQNELEAARKQLDSKYRAIKILQSQVAHAIMINKEKTKSIQQAEKMKKSLEDEVNSLQFDLTTSEEYSLLSQQTWAERFNRVCLENETLVATLQARTEQVRWIQLEKNAMKRERDELLARMDAKERLQYDRHKSATSDAFLYNSLAQFAVLGACLCRGSKPEPCGCAKAAARLKKENDILKDEVDKLQQNLEAVTLKADSFRTAFDNQLDQNSQLGQQIQKICCERRSQGQDEVHHWRKNDAPKVGCFDNENSCRSRSITRTDHHHKLSSETGKACRSTAIQVSDPQLDLIGTLTDLLNDKTEALAHQRLVAKMLARKMQELEKTMKQLNEYSK
ncbi:coiled-coil domain-containing protein 125-like isoform X2 [Acanthaster planci]|uniref:Coiled-coil domain-containing protein 125-like isoform X2 n=1 Tax=Acanthaster planci TaxID=133434 RepID=A0A8B7ZYI2_ACAPL|nr:coiled-coil domain-containing protein 125-like isoform X2 [Acanthaster planci]